jgi:hypothetical protein
MSSMTSLQYPHADEISGSTSSVDELGLAGIGMCRKFHCKRFATLWRRPGEAHALTDRSTFAF